MRKTHTQIVQELEAKGFSFTVNVIQTGYGRPKTKIRNLHRLLDMGYDVRHVQFETCEIIVDGDFKWLGALDNIDGWIERFNMYQGIK